MNLKKQQLKGVKIIGAPQVGTRTVNILMGEHAGEYVRGDIMDANAVIQAFDELKGNVDGDHNTLEEIVNEVHANSASVQRVETESKERDNQEAQARKDADAAESARATQAEANLKQAILDEEAARKSADNALSDKLNTEINRAKGQETTLQSNIDAEASARKNADDTITNNLNTEISRAKSAENTLQSNIDNEATIRKNADDTLTSNLNAEITRAKTAEKSNSDRIDIIDGDSSVEGSYRKAIKDLINGAPEAYDTLKEIADKLQDNDDLHQAIEEAIATKATKTDLNAEITRAKNAEQANTDAIVAEATRATGKEGELQTAINAEATRAKAVEDTKVDKVEGKQLSTNDYTTDEKNKLANIEAGANNYIHPTSAAGAISSGLYKITTDEYGHITAVTAVAQSDITTLGILANTDIEAISNEFINALPSYDQGDPE